MRLNNLIRVRKPRRPAPRGNFDTVTEKEKAC